MPLSSILLKEKRRNFAVTFASGVEDQEPGVHGGESLAGWSCRLELRSMKMVE
jgi:hypothetical protein